VLRLTRVVLRLAEVPQAELLHPFYQRALKFVVSQRIKLARRADFSTLDPLAAEHSLFLYRSDGLWTSSPDPVKVNVPAMPAARRGTAPISCLFFPRPFMRPLRQRTVSGLWWSTATLTLGNILQFATTVILARVLSPREFGLIGMILVITGFATSIADVGLGASIVQKQEPSDRDLDSVFWLNAAIGGALTLLFSLSAPLVARFYGEPLLRPLTVAVAFNFVIGSLNVVQYALLQKSLDFRTRFWIEIVAIATSGLFALVLALAGAGVWSLAGQSLCQNLTRTAQIWRLSSWRPRRIFDPAAVKGLLTFGWNLVGFNIVVYCAQNFDKLVIGRQIGSSTLGVYNLADRLMRLPLTTVTDVSGAVMFPALSELRDDIESTKRAYLRANRMIALFTFPMMLGFSVLAEPAILVIYGNGWRDAVVIAQLLCLAGMAQSIYNTAGWIFLSRGRTDILFRLGVLSMLVRVAGVLIGMHWALLGIAWAYLLGGYTFLLYPTLSLAGGLIGLRFTSLLKNVAAPFACAACMAAVTWISNHWLFELQAHWLQLALNVPIGIVVYCLLITRFKITAWLDVKELILEKGALR
jgi:O-antigen/teichoic acid export membrane protein